MAVLLNNNAVSNLAASLTSGATTLSVTSGQGSRFPAPGAGDWFPLTLVKSSGALEVVKCTARAGDVFTVTRAQEGTSAIAFGAGDRVELRLTAGALNAMFGERQPLDALLSAIAALTTSADKLLYFNGSDTPALSGLTAFMRTVLDDPDQATARDTLGANNASNLTTGTLADDRLSVTGPASPTMQNSFTNNGTSYVKVAGIVIVTVNVQRESQPTANSIMFTLPVGMRPAVTARGAGDWSVGIGLGHTIFSVETSGDVRQINVGAPSGATKIEGMIVFKAA